MARGPDPETPAEEILHEFIVSHEPAFVPSEIGNRLDITTEGARHRMNKLVDDGLLARKKPGPRTVLYWITEAGKKYYFENVDGP